MAKTEVKAQPEVPANGLVNPQALGLSLTFAVRAGQVAMESCGQLLAAQVGFFTKTIGEVARLGREIAASPTQQGTAKQIELAETLVTRAAEHVRDVSLLAETIGRKHLDLLRECTPHKT